MERRTHAETTWPWIGGALLCAAVLAGVLIPHSTCLAANCYKVVSGECISGDQECFEGSYKKVCPGSDCASGSDYACCTTSNDTVDCTEYMGDWHPWPWPHYTLTNAGGATGTCPTAHPSGACK
ncbi:MAG: hypothetical protein NTW86_06235 [Candidatus Sumerlaeota bacterium]|nr:hypothetical protein [Candidatus Sumerlaeota bacterium]